MQFTKMNVAQLFKLFSFVTQMRLVLVICSIFFLSASISEGAETLRHLQINDSNSRQIAAELLDQGFDVLEGSITPDQFEVIASVEELEILNAAGYSPKLLDIGRPLKDIQAEWQTDLSVPVGYLDYSETIAGMAATADNFPSICQLVDLTETYGTPATEEGRHLFALKISDNVSSDEDEPAFLMVSNQHANEVGAIILALKAIEQLTTQYGIDAEITDMVNNNEIWIAPIWNPDGYDHVFYVDSLWSKNRRLYGPYVVGVNLDRNYPHGWYSGSSGSSYIYSSTYKGPGPASEPETQTMLALSRDRHFSRILEYQTRGSLSRSDPHAKYGYRSWNHPLDEHLEEQAEHYCNIVGGTLGTHSHADAEGEHFQWQFGQRAALAILLRTFPYDAPSISDANLMADQVWPGVHYILQKQAPLWGYVTNASTGEPIAATISFPDIAYENDESCSSNERYGRYHSWLPFGWYDVVFEAEGFQPVTVPRVRVLPLTPNRVDIAMFPLASSVDNGSELADDFSVTSNSSTGVLSFKISKPSQVSLKVFDLRGALMGTLERDYQSAGRYEIAVPRVDNQGQALASGLYFYKIIAGSDVRSGKIVLVK